MIRDRVIQARDKLVGKLPVTAELLRGSLLERTVRHTKGCPKCARSRYRKRGANASGGARQPLSIFQNEKQGEGLQHEKSEPRPGPKTEFAPLLASSTTTAVCCIS